MHSRHSMSKEYLPSKKRKRKKTLSIKSFRLKKPTIKKQNVLRKRLKLLGYSSYYEYLKSDHWKNFKKYYYKYNPKICASCGSQEKLNLHHRTYKNLGRETFKDIICFCESCHNKKHNK